MHSQLLEQVNDLLMPAERVVYPAKPHSMMLLFPSVFFALAYGCFRANSLVHDVGYLFIVIALVLSVLALVSYQTTQVLITNQRVFIASGFIKREARGFFLDAIQHFELRQPAWAAILGCGDIVLTDLDGNETVFRMIAHPRVFITELRHVMALKQA